MEIPVLVERVAGNGFVAKMGEPFSITAIGADRTEALRNLQSVVLQRLQNGATIELLHVDGASESNPWVQNAGIFKDNPMFDEVLAIMAENRRKDDADPDN